MKLVPCEPKRLCSKPRQKPAIRITPYGRISFNLSLTEAMYLVDGHTVSFCYDQDDVSKWYIKRGGDCKLKTNSNGSSRTCCKSIVVEMWKSMHLVPDTGYLLFVNPDWIQYNGEHYFEIMKPKNNHSKPVV